MEHTRLMDGSTLHHYAAADALRTLIQNWEAARADPVPTAPDRLVADIDHAVELMLEARCRLTAANRDAKLAAVLWE